MNADAVDRTPTPRLLAAGAIVAVAVQIVALGAAIPASLVIARVTGADGTGAYGLAISLSTTATVIFGAGLAAGLTYYVSRREWPVRRAWRDVERAGARLGTVGGAAIVLAQVLLHDTALDGVTLTMAITLGLSAPFALAWTYSSALALATERYELLGLVQAMQPFVGLIGTVALVGPFGVTGAVVGFAASYPIAWALLHRRLDKALPPDPGPQGRAGVRPALSFGIRTWGADLLQLFNYRLDLFILNAFVERTVVGRYSVAVSLTALGWILPSALQTVLFPRAASLGPTGDAGDATVLAALRHVVVLLTVSLLVLLGLLALVPLAYGSDFEASVKYGLLLLPGVLAIGFAKPLSAVITGRGFPQYSLYNALLTTPLTVALYFVLIPELGGTGAAIASSVSYIVSTVIAAFYFHRVTGIRVSAALRSPRTVIADYALALRSLRTYVAALRARLRPPAPEPYRPEQYWENRAEDLIATYDAPDTWAAKGWTRGGVEEALVPPLLERAGARSAFVIGAGSGRQYGWLAPLGLELRGIDISPRLADECRRRFPDIETATDTVIGAEQRHAAADAVLSSAVLQHVPPDEIAAAITSVQALAHRIVVLRELTWLARDGAYVWAHDYVSAFAGWTELHREVTDQADGYQVTFYAWAREATEP